MRSLASIAPMLVGLAGLVCGLGGCSSSSTPPTPTPPPTVELSGNLAMDVSLSAASPRSECVVAEDICVVAITETGGIGDSDLLAQPLAPNAPFALTVPVAHDYVIEFRAGALDGATLAVLVMDPDNGARTVFSVPAESGDVDLGLISVDTAATTATSDIDETVCGLLPEPDQVYVDRDGDRVPDAFDRDDDDDGIPDDQDDRPGIVFYDMGGGRFDTLIPHGTTQADIWLTGTYHFDTGFFTLGNAAAPRISLFTDLSFVAPISAFDIWVDDIPLTLDGTGLIRAGHLRFGSPWGFVTVSANPDVDGSGTPGFDIVHLVFGEVAADSSLTWPEIAAIGVNPPDHDDYLITAWLGLGGIRSIYDSVRQLLVTFDFCMRNKMQILDAREFYQVDLVVPCEIFPGDGTQGSVSYGWQDNDGTGDINPGDSFSIIFENCWCDVPESSSGELFDGRFDFKHYIDIRPEPPLIHLGAAYVDFDDLTRTGTVEDAGVHSLDANSVTTTNSFSDNPTMEGPGLWVIH